MTDELKPCPFCGNPFEIVGDKQSGYIINHEFDCPMETSESETGFVYDSEEDAIAQLNTRPLEDALQARIDELEAENKALKLIANSHSMSELRRLQAQTGWRKYPPAPERKEQ